MMLVIFATLGLALLLGWFGRKSIALVLIVICLALAVKQFLWEIHSPEYGYRMPWIQTQVINPPQQRHSTIAFMFNPEIVHGDLI
ncbi:hypothetical protein KUG47_10325 [Falsochrobactrum sp. TDYN1]|uniref:Uncharacterized protein n=1 Tax=Falsochrobactrum tianjinense TaxID=2706015 RepID=A0A949PP54_9HYPH|nr:hypothetical protein [Falsochrobactrum sp. TDYN1]MBV2143890.1 hypothetical protein [Falsochrobactrum sp. TDYN1]